MKTRSVKFSYGTVKDASLLIPAEAYTIVDAVHLIRQSFLEYMFARPCLMSDEVLTSSIGHSNFFAGALGGWETRLTPETFKHLKDYAENGACMALAVAKYREPNATESEHYLRASRNEAISEGERKFLAIMAEHVKTPEPDAPEGDPLNP